MKQIKLVLLLVFGVMVSTVADAQTTVRLRGTITAVEGSTLSVRSREGENLALQMPDNLAVAVAKAIKFEDIKQGDYVGAVAINRYPGARNADLIKLSKETGAPLVASTMSRCVSSMVSTPSVPVMPTSSE